MILLCFLNASIQDPAPNTPQQQTSISSFLTVDSALHALSWMKTQTVWGYTMWQALTTEQKAIAVVGLAAFYAVSHSGQSVHCHC